MLKTTKRGYNLLPTKTRGRSEEINHTLDDKQINLTEGLKVYESGVQKTARKACARETRSQIANSRRNEKQNRRIEENISKLK